MLAQHGLVVMTFNYRLGALGSSTWPTLPEPTWRTRDRLFLDQVAALRWVRDNISGFGGDPRRVTTYEVPAGAKSVANVIASPLTAGLMSRAISSSGGAEHEATPQQAIRVAAQEAIHRSPGHLAVAPRSRRHGHPGPADRRGELRRRRRNPAAHRHNGAEGASYQLMDATSAGQAPRVLAELFGTPTAAEMPR